MHYYEILLQNVLKTMLACPQFIFYHVSNQNNSKVSCIIFGESAVFTLIFLIRVLFNE